MKNLMIISALGLSLAFSYGFKPQASHAASYQEPAKKEETYRLIVSFMSKGAGANSEQKKAFLAYVDTHHKKPTYTTVLWGREGESDYCFKLTELSKKEQASFIAEVKKLVAPSPLAVVEENAVCKHHGRLQTKN